MTNSEMLLTEVKVSGLKLKYIAKELGLTPYGLSKKIYGINEFKASEIVKMTDVLHLSQEKRDAIFFAIYVDGKSTL